MGAYSSWGVTAWILANSPTWRRDPASNPLLPGETGRASVEEGAIAEADWSREAIIRLFILPSTSLIDLGRGGRALLLTTPSDVPLALGYRRCVVRSCSIIFSD